MVERVFISYVHGDSDFVRKLANDLETHKVPIWVDKRDIPIGSRWPAEIQQALQDSTGFLVVLTPESAGSTWVRNEIGYAQKIGKIVVPVLLRECDIPIELNIAQYIDFCQTAYDHKKYDQAFRRLLRVLQPHPEKDSADHRLSNEPLTRRKSIGPRGIPDLFIANIFAIPEENPQRDARMKQLLSNRRIERLRLLARTGFNYLHDLGKNYQAGFGEHLRMGKQIQVLLESPYSQFAEARLRASPGGTRWDKLSPERIRKLLNLYPDNLAIRFTENPVYCSLFFTYESVIYDPYHLGRRGWAERVGNQFLVIEFERPPQEHCYGPRDYYALLENHFQFLWGDRTQTFDDLCAEHPEELGYFAARKQ